MPGSPAPKPRSDRPDEDLARQAERRAWLLQAANQVGQQIASIRILKELLSKTVDVICDVYGFCRRWKCISPGVKQRSLSTGKASAVLPFGFSGEAVACREGFPGKKFAALSGIDRG